MDSQEFLGRLQRQESGNRELAVVASPGARANGWAIMVTGHVAYNVYTVQPVMVGEAGEEPSAVGMEMEATNLAEPFLQQGQVAAGTYAMMLRAGEKYVFYAKG